MASRHKKENKLSMGVEDTAGAKMELYGVIEEAVSALGLARSLSSDAGVKEMVHDLQSLLLAVGVELCSHQEEGNSDEHLSKLQVEKLDELIGELQSKIEMPDYYSIPGQRPSSSAMYLARAIVKRCEREASRLVLQGERSNKYLAEFLKRLSDVIYLLALCEDRRREIAPIQGKQPARHLNIA